MKTKTLFSAITAILVLASSAGAAVIVSESFGGLGSANLNGTAADTFAAGITTASGSSTWVGATVFKANGSVTGVYNSANLNLGSYINDAKGTAAGQFVLQTTVTKAVMSAGTGWLALGFSTLNSPSTANNFADSAFGTGTTLAVATMLYRDNGDIDQFAGIGATSPVAADDVIQSGIRTLTITLDLTTAGGYNGTTNFGTVYYGADTGAGGIYEQYGTSTYTSARDFNSILLSVGGGQTGTATGTFSNLTLTQIPEPSAALLGAFGLLALFRRRR